MNVTHIIYPSRTDPDPLRPRGSNPMVKALTQNIREHYREQPAVYVGSAQLLCQDDQHYQYPIEADIAVTVSGNTKPEALCPGGDVPKVVIAVRHPDDAPNPPEQRNLWALAGVNEYLAFAPYHTEQPIAEGWRISPNGHHTPLPQSSANCIARCHSKVLDLCFWSLPGLPPRVTPPTAPCPFHTRDYNAAASALIQRRHTEKRNTWEATARIQRLAKRIRSLADTANSAR